MNKIIVLALFIIVGLLFESLLVFTFPYSELAGMVNYPIVVFVSIIVSAIVLYFNIKKIVTIQD